MKNVFSTIACLSMLLLVACEEEEIPEPDLYEDTYVESEWKQCGQGLDGNIRNLFLDKNGKLFLNGSTGMLYPIYSGVYSYNNETWDLLNENLLSAVDANGTIYAITQYRRLISLIDSKEILNIPLPDSFSVVSMAIDTSGAIYLMTNYNKWEFEPFFNIIDIDRVYCYSDSKWRKIFDDSNFWADAYYLCSDFKWNAIYMKYHHSSSLDNYTAFLKWDQNNWIPLMGSESLQMQDMISINWDHQNNPYVYGHSLKFSNTTFFKWNLSSESWSVAVPEKSFIIDPTNQVAPFLAFDSQDSIYSTSYNSITHLYSVVINRNGKWCDVGKLNANGYIYSICFGNDGTIYAAGSFRNRERKYCVRSFKK